MPEWLTILLAIIGGIGTLCGILGISAYFSQRAKHKADEVKEKKDKLAEAEHELYKAELKEIIREETADIRQGIDIMQKDLVLVKEGLQEDLYVDLQHIGEEYISLGYANRGMKHDYAKLYTRYHNLGQNGVADRLYHEVMDLPDEAPTGRAPRKGKNNKVKNSADAE